MYGEGFLVGAGGRGGVRGGGGFAGLLAERIRKLFKLLFQRVERGFDDFLTTFDDF
jgi:hypothetical protein